MAENLNNIDTELDLNELEGVSGGVMGSSAGTENNRFADIVAYCLICKRQLQCLGTMRVPGQGATTNIFVCTNKTCPEFSKRKDNLHVQWPSGEK